MQTELGQPRGNSNRVEGIWGTTAMPRMGEGVHSQPCTDVAGSWLQAPPRHAAVAEGPVWHGLVLVEPLGENPLAAASDLTDPQPGRTGAPSRPVSSWINEQDEVCFLPHLPVCGATGHPLRAASCPHNQHQQPLTQAGRARIQTQGPKHPQEINDFLPPSRPPPPLARSQVGRGL